MVYVNGDTRTQTNDGATGATGEAALHWQTTEDAMSRLVSDFGGCGCSTRPLDVCTQHHNTSDTYTHTTRIYAHTPRECTRRAMTSHATHCAARAQTHATAGGAIQP